MISADPISIGKSWIISIGHNNCIPLQFSKIPVWLVILIVNLTYLVNLYIVKHLYAICKHVISNCYPYRQSFIAINLGIKITRYMRFTSLNIYSSHRSWLLAFRKRLGFEWWRKILIQVGLGVMFGESREVTKIQVLLR